MIIRRASACALLVLVFATASCADGEPAIEAPVASDTVTSIPSLVTASPDALVIERRPITFVERDLVDNDRGMLDCSDPGGVIWDYGPIGPDEARGRTADDALLDAINDLNEQTESEGVTAFVPLRGWIELTDDPGTSFFVDTTNDLQFQVRVDGDPELGVWRHSRALLCPP